MSFPSLQPNLKETPPSQVLRCRSSLRKFEDKLNRHQMTREKVKKSIKEFYTSLTNTETTVKNIETRGIRTDKRNLATKESYVHLPQVSSTISPTLMFFRFAATTRSMNFCQVGSHEQTDSGHTFVQAFSFNAIIRRGTELEGYQHESRAKIIHSARISF